MTLTDWWFLAVATLFTGYFVLEGFDFGVGMLMPIIGRRRRGAEADLASRSAAADTKRRVLLNTIGPVWDGNEVWLLTGGGAMFAAFPGWYATTFSAAYLALLLILVGLIVRVVAIEWRGKIDDPNWRRWCDVGIGLGSWLPALLWGVAFANFLRGLPINAEHQFTGNFFDLLSVYTLLGGLTTLLLFAAHGAIFLGLKTFGEIQQEAMQWASRLAASAAVAVTAMLLWTQLDYGKGWTWAPVIVGIVAAWAMAGFAIIRREGFAFAASAGAVISLMVTIFGSMYPVLLPSTTDSAFDLTTSGTSSTHYTLTVMSWAAIIFLPVVIGYQAWTYWVFRKRISTDQIPPSIGLPLKEPAAPESAQSG